MTLYIKRKKAYVAMTKQEVRRLRRHEEVMALNVNARLASATLFALAGWLSVVDKQAKRMQSDDLYVASLPNQERLREISKKLDEAVKKVEST